MTVSCGGSIGKEGRSEAALVRQLNTAAQDECVVMGGQVEYYLHIDGGLRWSGTTVLQGL